jgi:Lrp/AsnC family transcriptional regulator for asnA, asnC and gidA
VALDAIDKHILEALQADGRASFRTIARRVGVSEATVRSRYNRLHRSNAMQVTAVTNPLGLGYEAPALVAIKTSGSTEAISDQIAEWKEASYVVIVAGQFDLIVEVVCADRSHLLDVLERIRTIEGILSTETFTYLQLRKQVYNWGAGADGALWKGAGGNR